jgi:hypothetical protein
LNIISSVNIKQIFINNTKNGIQCFGKKTFTRAIFTCQYKKNIQLLKAALNELYSLLMDRKDYPIGAYIHACSTTTNTQIEKFNKFIGYLDELENPLFLLLL